jgi:hypothetical protein
VLNLKATKLQKFAERLKRLEESFVELKMEIKAKLKELQQARVR